MSNRLFVSEQVLDRWISEAAGPNGEPRAESPQAESDEQAGKLFDRKTGLTYHVKSAVYFLSELTGNGDAAGLLGRVKDLNQLESIGADYARGSVILGEIAYEVQEGFVCEPTEQEAPRKTNEGKGLADALRDLTSDPSKPPGALPDDDDMDLLARLFLSKRPDSR